MKPKTIVLAMLCVLLVSPAALAQVSGDAVSAQTPEETQTNPAETAPTTATYETAAEEPAAEAETETDEMLPQTASPLALLALLGLGSTGAAVGLRKLRRS